MVAPRDVVHQINFGLQPEGISVLGGTLSDDDMLFWRRRLQVHLRLQRFEGALPPETALSTFEFTDGWTAVVRRWNSGGTIGRNDAMALIARSAWLPMPVVLGLDQRFGWEAASKQQYPFQKWDAEQLQELGHEGARELRAPARELHGLLRRTLGPLFDAPEQPLTIVGCSEEQRIPLLWGLHRLAARQLLDQNVRRLWTFSTYEAEDADSIAHLPAIVFMPERPVVSTVSRRTLVDVRVDGKVSPAGAGRARRRVDMFLAGREDEPEFGPTPATPSAPVREVALVGGERARTGGPTGPSAGGPDSGAEWMNLPSTHTPADDSRQSGPRDVGVPPQLAAAVNRLRLTLTSSDLPAAMDVLQSHTATPDVRAALRAWLGPQGYAQLAVEVANRLLAPTEHRQFFRSMHAVAFAPDRVDLRDDSAACRFAVNVLQTRPGMDLSLTLFSDLTQARGEELVFRKLALQWLEDHGLPTDVVEEADGPAPRATSVEPLTPAASEAPHRWWHLFWSPRPAQQQGWRPGRTPRATAQSSRPRLEPSTRSWALTLGLGATVVVVVLAVIAFVAFFPAAPENGRAPVAGGPTTALPGGRSDPATWTTTPTPTTTTAAPVTAPVLQGSVSARNLVARLPKAAAPSGAVVYLLLRPLSTTDFFYYRTQCDDQSEPGWWVCRQPPDRAAPPLDDAGYDVVLVTGLRGEPQTWRNGVVIVGQPEQGDYVVPPVPVAP